MIGEIFTFLENSIFFLSIGNILLAGCGHFLLKFYLWKIPKFNTIRVCWVPECTTIHDVLVLISSQYLQCSIAEMLMDVFDISNHCSMHFSTALWTLSPATWKIVGFFQFEWGPFFAIFDQNKCFGNRCLPHKYGIFSGKSIEFLEF